MDRVLQSLASLEECELSRLVEKHHGPQAVMNDEKLLRAVFESRVTGAGLAGPERRGRQDVVDEFKELQEELQMDVRMAIQENAEQFEAMFAIQQKELEHQMRRTMQQEGDRIIDAFISGPHERILDLV